MDLNSHKQYLRTLPSCTRCYLSPSLLHPQLMQIGQQQAAPSRSMKSTPSLQHRMSEARQQPPLPSPAPNVDLETATCTTRLSPRLPTASRAASRASESVLAPASRAAHSPRKSAQVPADEPAAALDASPTVIQPVKRTPTPASKRSASPSLRTASSPDVPTPTTPQPPVVSIPSCSV